jgi:hypothetical protein
MSHNLKCRICGAGFIGRNVTHNLCSDACRKEARARVTREHYAATHEVRDPDAVRIRCRVCGRGAITAGLLLTDVTGTSCIDCRAVATIETVCAKCGETFQQPRAGARLYCSGVCRTAGKAAADAEAERGTRQIIGSWQIGNVHRSVVLLDGKYRCQHADEDEHGRYTFAEPVFVADRETAIKWARGEAI